MLTTNDKVLLAYERINNDSNDGIYFDVIDRSVPLPVPAGSEITGTNIIPRSTIFHNEPVIIIVLDANFLDQPSGYIISLCFSTFDGNTSKLYMGRVTQSSDNLIWTQCADSPKTYLNSEILDISSSFLNVNGGTPIKIINIRNPDHSQSVIVEHH